MTSGFEMVDHLAAFIRENFSSKYDEDDLFEEILTKDIIRVLSYGIEDINVMPSEIFFFDITGNVSFHDYKEAPALFTGVDQYTYDNGGLIVMKLFCGQIYRLYDSHGVCLSDDCHDLDLSVDGRVLLRTSSSFHWEEFIYSGGKLVPVNIYDPSESPPDFRRIFNEHVDDDLFPPYSFFKARENWMAHLSGEEVKTLLADPNFSYRFRKSLAGSFSGKSMVEAYQFLIQYYHDNEDLATLAVISNCLAFALLSKRLQDSREFVFALLTKNDKTRGIYPFLNQQLKKDKEIVKLCLSWNVDILEEFAPVSDRELIIQAIKTKGHAFRYASEELKSDRNFNLEAVKMNGKILKYFPDDLRADKEIVLEAVKQTRKALKYASDQLKRDTEFLGLINENDRTDHPLPF